jgi:DNA-binding transcriptional LysR family regulator
MNYEWLRSFTVFADHLNFTRAAAQLHISQPALHVQVKKLSEQVGRSLYRRAGRGLALTREGTRLAAFGREVDERGRAVLEEVRGQALSGPVVLAAGQGALLHLLAPAIRRLPRRAGPLRLLTMSGPAAVQAVGEGRAHLGVAVRDPDASPEEDSAGGLVWTALRSVGQRAIVPSAHRLARRRAIRPADLDGEALVVAPAGSPHRRILSRLLADAGAGWTVAVEATGWEPMVHFARLGIGVAVVNDFCPAPPGTVAVRIDGAPRAEYHLVERPAPRSVGVDALRALIVEVARENPRRPAGRRSPAKPGG